jgi:hypothetical protein
MTTHWFQNHICHPSRQISCYKPFQNAEEFSYQYLCRHTSTMRKAYHWKNCSMSSFSSMFLCVWERNVDRQFIWSANNKERKVINLHDETFPILLKKCASLFRIDKWNSKLYASFHLKLNSIAAVRTGH